MDITPTNEEILKYQLWEEQKHICLYTQETIGIADFIGGNTKYDIEHTIPRSRGGDDSQANKTLCNNTFNREIKRVKLPSELSNAYKTMAVIEECGWKEKIENLEKQISTQIKKAKAATTKEIKDNAIKQRHYLKMQLDYWRDKLARFTITETDKGFTNRQSVDIGIISRYARMYLQTAFPNVHTVKGSTTSDFRKMWGLQEEYTKKERINHVHHCIDAITIACIRHEAYTAWKQYNCDIESYKLDHKEKPHAEKPWETFIEDVKAIAEELLISHHTPDNMPKQSRKKLRIKGKVQTNNKGETKYIQGDTARRALHLQTFYGAIMRNDDIKYVVRKPISSLESNEIKNIVDDKVRECVQQIYEREGKAALQSPILFNKEKNVFIKKVRIYVPSVKQPIHLKKHQFLSRHEYKQDYYVANDSNYCMAIYEGSDNKGRKKRSFEIVNILDASNFFNHKGGRYIVPQSDENDYPLKYLIKCGTMVLFYENSPEELYSCNKKELAKRLYKVKGLAGDGRITFIYHQEARKEDLISKECGMGYSKYDVNNPKAKLRLSLSNFNAYVEGYDFELTITGEVKFKH